MSWQKDWKKYVNKQTKFFTECGCKYPRTGNEPISEITAKAIMEVKK